MHLWRRIEIEDDREGEGSEAEMESREIDERRRMKVDAEEPKAPKVSRTKGTKRELESVAREAKATAREEAGMERRRMGNADIKHGGMRGRIGKERQDIGTDCRKVRWLDLGDTTRALNEGV